MIDTISKVIINENIHVSILEITWNEYQEYINKLVNLIKNNNSYQYIYGVPRGGIIPSISLSYALNIPIIFNYNTKDKILVVDDIVDSGKTMSYFIGSDFASIIYKIPNDLMPKFYSKKLEKNLWIKFPWEV